MTRKMLPSLSNSIHRQKRVCIWHKLEKMGAIDTYVHSLYFNYVAGLIAYRTPLQSRYSVAL